jgi:uncharacterized protein
MTFEVALLLLMAGLAGGAINAVAGGATLLTFPAMIAAGLPPVVANASSSFALTPGHFFGAMADRDQLPRFDGPFWLSLIVMMAGAACGATLLFLTPERYFTALIPVLIGFATLVFACGKALREWLTKSAPPGDRLISRLLWLFPTAVYVGYFGAGAGVVMMALFSVTTAWQVRTANAVKNLYGSIGNWCAIAIFIASGLIAWQESCTMLVGAVVGGLIGGRLLKFMSPATIRIIVIAAGILVSVAYAWKYWL